MKKTLGFAASLLLTGLSLHCGNSSNTTPDMAMTPADLAVAAAADMAKQPADMAQQPADMVTPVFNGCTTAMFTDKSAAGDTRTVMFPNANLTYSPKCILISANQAVLFSGDLAAHPLKAGASGVAAGSPNSPILTTSTGSSVSFTFPTAGEYPYYCTKHDGMGMNGVVRVK